MEGKQIMWNRLSWKDEQESLGETKFKTLEVRNCGVKYLQTCEFSEVENSQYSKGAVWQEVMAERLTWTRIGLCGGRLGIFAW